MHTEITGDRVCPKPLIAPHVATGLSAVVAAVWIAHGLFNKLLHADPRHLQIVREVPIFSSHAELVLAIVGVGEILVGGWVLSGRRPRLCALVQTAALLSMNALELKYARPLLLWPAALVPVNLVFLGLAWLAAEMRLHAEEPPVDSEAPLVAQASVPYDGGTMHTCPLGLALRRHPLPVVAHFRHCLVLTYALDPKSLAAMLPPGLTLDTYKSFAFLAVALVQTERLRPAGIPRCLGRDFFLAGYRIFTRFDSGGRTLRGLRILRSSTDRRIMQIAGNLLTHYNYRPCRADINRDGETELAVRVTTSDGSADLDVLADLRECTDGKLPAGSPFENERDARRFAGPLPWTFDYEAQTNSIIAIKGVRANWNPRLIPVCVTRNTFLEHGAFRGLKPVLASAFYVRDIDYRWERGIRFPLKEA